MSGQLAHPGPSNPAAAQQRAARVAGAADLLDVRLITTECSLETTSVPAELGVGLDVTHEVEHDAEEGVLVVRIRFDLRIFDAADDTSAVATVCAIWAALYELVDLDGYEPTEDEWQAYAQTSATAALVPYAREFITSMTNRLGLPKLVLPIFRLPSPWHPDDDAAVGDRPQGDQ